MGGIVYGATYQSVFPEISAIANLGSVTLPGALGIDLWLTILLFVLIAVTLFYFLERHGELRKSLPLLEPEQARPVEAASELVAVGSQAVGDSQANVSETDAGASAE